MGNELMDAKTKESNALQASIEAKIKKIGDLAVEIVQLKNDLGEAGQALEEDKKFLADLEKGCATKTAEWEERSKTRAEELLALADTIKVLNDDDALELFKKTLPSASASFMQVSASSEAMRTRALAFVRAAAQKPSRDRARLEFIALALAGKKMAAGGFEKVIKMIDDMVQLLKDEQVADDNKKEYCAVQFDDTDDKKKAVTIDRIYPFHSDHITVCSGDAADPNDLVTTLNMGDYAPDKEEEDKLMQEES